MMGEIDGYILTLAALLILSDSLGDRYGRRRIMVIGLIGFGITAVTCGLAPTTLWLIAARVLQGMAGALLVPGSLAIIRSVYADPEARGQAIGQWAGWSGIVVVIGPLIGGWLVDNLSWRWVFFVVVPFIAVAVWLMLVHVPESRAEDASEYVDWLGAALITLGLGGIAYGLIEGPIVSWRMPRILIALATSIVSLLLFPFAEKRKREPMVPLQLFSSRNFTGANLTTLGVYFALQGNSFFAILYLQNIMEYSALQAGLALAPISLLLLVLSPLFGKISGRYGARLLMTAGPLVCAIGLLLFTRLHLDASFWTGVLPAVGVFGLGLAGTVAPLTNTVMSAVSDRHWAVAAAFNNVVSRVAGLLAVAGLGVLLTLTFNTVIASRIERLSLSGSTMETIERMADEPTGAFDVAQLPSEARLSVISSYTVAFHRTMILSAAMAAAGGVAAAFIIRDRDGGESTG